MDRLKSLEELKRIREKAVEQTRLRAAGENPDRISIVVGLATCGIAAGARATMKALSDEVNKLGLSNVTITATGCVGLCYAEPIVEVRAPGKPAIRYGNVDGERAREIINRHIVGGELLDHAIVGREVPT